MIVGVVGLRLAGRKNRWGWAVGLGAQGLWVAYSLVTQQYGFLVSAFAYGYVYAKNFLAWRRPVSPESDTSHDVLEPWEKPERSSS